MNQEQYIEHEIKIRVLQELNDERFKQVYEKLDDKFVQLNNKFNWLLLLNAGVLTSIIIPIILHILKLS